MNREELIEEICCRAQLAHGDLVRLIVEAVVSSLALFEKPEPEYEYRLVLELHPPKHAAWDQAETLWYPTVEEARATGKARGWIAHYRIDYPRARFTERVERRVVAGEAEVWRA